MSSQGFDIQTRLRAHSSITKTGFFETWRTYLLNIYRNLGASQNVVGETVAPELAHKAQLVHCWLYGSQDVEI